MAQFIVGDWNEFTFELAMVDHDEEVVKHLREHFEKDEPMNVYLKDLDEDGKTGNTSSGIRKILSHHCSFLVRERATGELAGVQLIADTRSQGSEIAIQPEVRAPPSIKKYKILSFLSQLEKNADAIFQRDFQCEFYAEVFISSVSTNYRQRGLAKEMFRRTIPFLRGKGFPVLRSSFTTVITRKIGSKFGFTEIGRLYYKKDAKGENGEQLFPMAGDGEEEYASEIAYVI